MRILEKFIQCYSIVEESEFKQKLGDALSIDSNFEQLFYLMITDNNYYFEVWRISGGKYLLFEQDSQFWIDVDLSDDFFWLL